MPSLKRRDLVLLLAGIAVFSLTTWRILNPRGLDSAPAEVPENLHPAPAFELYDQNSRLVKLEAYLHRHIIVLVFFSGTERPDENRTLLQLREFHSTLKENGVIVIAVSNALPQQIRNGSEKPFPFPILSDVTPERPGSPCQLWGRSTANGISPGVFLIDRSGLVSWSDDRPSPVGDSGQLIRRLVAGE